MSLKKVFFLLALWIQAHGFPLCDLYIRFCEGPFLNFSAEEATGVEWAGNLLLAPSQYLFDGLAAIPADDPEVPYRFEERFDYSRRFHLKMPAAACALPASLLLGSTVKALAFIFPETRQRHERIKKAFHNRPIRLHHNYYREIGLAIDGKEKAPFIAPPEHRRRAGDEKALAADRQALKEIVAILDKEGIFYWADCGTCLGAYRYGGTIPWDNDIDIGIFQKDFQNAKQALKQLDPKKYSVQDWSSRGKRESYLKVFEKEALILIDIYQYAIDEEAKTLNCIISGMDNIFLTRDWKKHEKKYETPAPFEMIFPLKRAQLDEVTVYVPNRTKEYLQLRYGENIEPTMLYDPNRNEYVRDPAHPYWH